MINKTFKMMWFFYLKFMYRHVYRDLYRQDSQIVETNLRIAFNSTFTDARYRKLTRAILDRRLRSWINDFWNHPASYLSAFQYVFFLLYKWIHEQGFQNSMARMIRVRYLRRKRRIWRDERRRWSVFLRYFLNFRVRNLSVIEEQLQCGNGVLLCAFHTGYYRVLADYLTARGYRVKMLVDRNVYEREFQTVANKLAPKKDYLSGNAFDFLVAEDASVGLKIMNALRQNDIVLFFLDGNTGLGKNGNKADTTSFFNQEMYIRRGAIQIALKNGTPIVPVMSKWHGHWVPEFTFLEPIQVLNQAFSLPRNALNLARHLYSLYERAIRHDPTQWDQWFDCHRFWVNQPAGKTAVSFQEFQQKKQELMKAMEKKKSLQVQLCQQRVSYFSGRKGVALVDLHAVRFFEAGPFLSEFLPWLKIRKRVSLKKIISCWKKHFDTNTILEAITRMELMNFIEVKS